MKKPAITLVLCLFCFYTVTAAFAVDISAAQEQTAGEAPVGQFYGIGSVSKVFTAAAVMKLVDEGQINLDEPLITYVPDFSMADERYLQITPRMLLNHSSGLMGTTDNNAVLAGDNSTYNHDHFLKLLQMQTLRHQPGDRSIYSNDSFTLAEILVESVSGMSFTDFIERRLALPLGLKNIKTPQSRQFDRSLLAGTYLNNGELKPQNLNIIGTGGIYATLEDLCRFATIFMDSADGSVLSRQAVREMAAVQHQREMVSPDADTTYRYGLGWDNVEKYPFNRYGIKALSKGGSTMAYYTNLTVLPEYNLAAAVASAGDGGLEELIAQEIILAVLEEEGLIPAGTALELPEHNLNRTIIPENFRSYEGFYDMGMLGIYHLAFTETSLILTPVGVRNERKMEFLYNTDGEFVSTNGDCLGLDVAMAVKMGTESTARGVTTLAFADGGNTLVAQSYVNIPGLSLTAEAMPIGERIVANPVSAAAQNAWTVRNDKEYLLVNERHTSTIYLGAVIAKTLTDERIPGYVIQGIYQGGGKSFSAVKITDEDTGRGYQNIPTILGRDIVNMSAVRENGVEYLYIKNFRYIDAAAAKQFSELDETIVIDSETIWVDVDEGLGGQVVSVISPENGSWFVYDDKMNCIATSLEKNQRDTIVLPENGRLAFSGEAGAEFTVR